MPVCRTQRAALGGAAGGAGRVVFGGVGQDLEFLQQLHGTDVLLLAPGAQGWRIFNRYRRPMVPRHEVRAQARHGHRESQPRLQHADANENVVEWAGAARAGVAVLGWEHRQRPGSGGAGAARAVHAAALGRRAADHRPARLAAPAARCTEVAAALVADRDARPAGRGRLQQPGLSRRAQHDGGQRAAAAVGDAAVHPGGQPGPVWRAAELAAGGRHSDFGGRGGGDRGAGFAARCCAS